MNTHGAVMHTAHFNGAKPAVAQRLASAMKDAGIRNARLAKRCDISVQGVGEWLKTGRIAPRHFPEICNVVGCSIEWLTAGLDLDPAMLRLAHVIQSLRPRDRAYIEALATRLAETLEVD